MSQELETIRSGCVQDLLDSLPYRAVIIDQNGVIQRANTKWKKFARENDLSLDKCGIGVNYINVSEEAEGEDSENASRTAQGIRQVLDGEKEEFSVEYSCHSPEKRYWFKMRAVAYGEGALILHEDITERKLFEEELAQTNKQLNDEFIRAKNLHDSMLPETLPDSGDIKFATYYEPAHKLGGDFYNFLETEEQLVFYISDVSGHDLSSSMVNVFLKEAINSFARAPGCLSTTISDPLNPGDIVRYVQENFQDFGLPADYFISLIVGVIDKTGREGKDIKLSNMGIHFPPKLIKDGVVSSVADSEMPITTLEDIDYNYDVTEINLNPGDIFFACTDGLLEQEAAKDKEMFGEERLMNILTANHNKSPEKIISEINRSLDEFMGEKNLQDDLSYLILKYQD